MYSSSKTSMSDFKIERQLGKGSFSSVYLVTRIADQKIYALKSVIMDKLTKKEQQNSVNEVRILASVSHPNVIGYREAFWDDNNQTLNIVMEYADDGDLQTKIHQMKKNNGIFEEEIIWSYAIQMIEGLKALHDKKIMHRDLKSANIFLAKSKNKKICKIGDMNVSKVVKEKVLMTQTGTPYYASPEVWNDKPYSYKSDLWSIGCVIYELCALRPPFKGKDLDELYINVCKGKVERIKKIYSEKLWKMILMLLQVDVNKRVDCDQFLNHPIIVQKIKEMKMKDSEYNVLEENKNTRDGLLLNTIYFKDLKEIKAQLPKQKNYGNTFENKMEYNYYNNNYMKKDYFTNFESKKLSENTKEYNINNKSDILIGINPITKNISNENNFNTNYYNYLNERINKLLNSNNNNNKNYNYNINNNNIYKNNNYYNYNSNHLNIINDKSPINQYSDYINKLGQNDILHTEENKKVNNKYSDREANNNSNNKNYNLYDQILQTDVAINNLLKKNNSNKMNMNNDIRYTYENLNTEERIDYNEKIMKLKKEKNKIIEKQKDIQNLNTKTIEDKIKEYKNLFNKKLEPTEEKFNNYLNMINKYNSKDTNNNIQKNEYRNSLLNNQLEHKLSKKHGMTLSPNPHTKNLVPSTSTRKGVLDSEIMFKKINNKNGQNKGKNNLENKKSTKLCLNKKNPSYNNFKERAKTPTSKFVNKSSTKVLMNKKIDFNDNKNSLILNNNKMININNTQNSIINHKPKEEFFSSLDNKNKVNNIKKNITTNPIKRINKPYMNINKKRNVGIDNNPNSKMRQKSSLIIKKYNSKNSNMFLNNNDITNFDLSNISNDNPKYKNKYLKYDFKKEINDINLTCVEDKMDKNTLYQIPKITIENSEEHSNIITHNNYINKNLKAYNKKYSVTLNNNNNIENNKRSITNKKSEYNFKNPDNNQSNNQNIQIMQYAKKLSARSNSYRITSHGNNNGYMNKKRKINYKYDLTEPEEKINNNLKLNTSKAKNSQIINYSLMNNGVNFMSMGNSNINSNDFVNNIKSTINNNNRLDDRYYLNMQNSTKTPQIFNNYYSINGVVTSSSPIKVINVFNN